MYIGLSLYNINDYYRIDISKYDFIIIRPDYLLKNNNDDYHCSASAEIMYHHYKMLRNPIKPKNIIVSLGSKEVCNIVLQHKIINRFKECQDVIFLEEEGTTVTDEIINSNNTLVSCVNVIDDNTIRFSELKKYEGISFITENIKFLKYPDVHGFLIKVSIFRYIFGFYKHVIIKCYDSSVSNIIIKSNNIGFIFNICVNYILRKTVKMERKLWQKHLS